MHEPPPAPPARHDPTNDPTGPVVPAPAAAPPLLLTIRDVARECGTRVHRAAYAVKEHGIEPRQRVGIIRLWSRDQLPAVRAALVKVVHNRTYLPPPRRQPKKQPAAVPA